MKLISYQREGSNHIGALLNETVVEFPVTDFPTTMRDLIFAGSSVLSDLDSAIKTDTFPHFDISDVRLLAPLPDPNKIVGIGLNYRDHCKEANLPIPARPLVFAKFASSMIGTGDSIQYDPALTHEVDYEVELGVIIGRRARYVAEKDALDCVFGYTAVNDVSARDLQFSDGQWVRAKSLDTFFPSGPCIVTRDEIPDPQALTLRCIVNGVILQNSSTAEMIFGVAAIIADLSRAFTLEPGDLIATGTPAGVGMSRSPKVFLQNGDLLVTEVGGIGKLENPVQYITALA